MHQYTEYNNQSCASIPDCVISNSKSDSTLYTCRSRNWVISDFEGVEDFQVEIDWRFGRNGKGCMRAYKKGGMNFCKFMRFFRYGIELTGEDRAKCIELLKNRIQCNLGIDFTNGILFRSRFVVACFYPLTLLQGREIHHISASNPLACTSASLHGINLTQTWLRGTDDRIANLQIVTPEMHRKIHEHQGDVWWFQPDRDFEPGGGEELNTFPVPPQNSTFQPPVSPPFGIPNVRAVDYPTYYNVCFRRQEDEVDFFKNLANELGVNLDTR